MILIIIKYTLGNKYLIQIIESYINAGGAFVSTYHNSIKEYNQFMNKSARGSKGTSVYKPMSEMWDCEMFTNFRLFPLTNTTLECILSNLGERNKKKGREIPK